MDKKLEYLHRMFIADPENTELARAFMNLYRRLGLELPMDSWQLGGFFEGNLELMKSWVSVMDYGDPSHIAFYMRLDEGDEFISNEWVKDIIETSTIGNPAGAALKMARNRYATNKWTKFIIENSVIGNPRAAASEMAFLGLATWDWVKKVDNGGFDEA
jgi:hypothetical protein